MILPLIHLLILHLVFFPEKKDVSERCVNLRKSNALLLKINYILQGTLFPTLLLKYLVLKGNAAPKHTKQ